MGCLPSWFKIQVQRVWMAILTLTDCHMKGTAAGVQLPAQTR